MSKTHKLTLVRVSVLVDQGLDLSTCPRQETSPLSVCRDDTCYRPDLALVPLRLLLTCFFQSYVTDIYGDTGFCGRSSTGFESRQLGLNCPLLVV